MRKYFIAVLLMILFLVVSCSNGQNKGQPQLYENKDLGISFQYPINFKVYQSDKDSLTVDSGYGSPEHPLASIQIGIKKYSPNRISLQEIESIVNPDFSGFVKILEASITEEGREEFKRQLEFAKKTDSDTYKLAYGDKTIDEATEEQVKTIQKQIEDIRTKRTYKIFNKGNYELIVVDSAEKYYPYYLLSDKGTFIVDHLQPWRGGFVPEQEYDSYKEKFDSIVNSIKII